MTDWLLPFLEARPEGLYAPAFDAYLDPSVRVSRAILSHAHADHAAAGHGEIWGTPHTIALYRRRNIEWVGNAREIALGEPVAGAGAVLEAFEAGHVLGSVQLRLSNAHSSLLYTGDFKRHSGRTTSAAQAPQTSVLLTEATFGLPVFRFPPLQVIEDGLIAACRDAIVQQETPILLAHALGKTQEAAAALTEAGIPTVWHGAAWNLLPEYERAGLSFPLSRAYESGPPRPGEAFLVPPRCARTPIVQKIKKRRVLYLSGWAIRSASRADFDADVLLPFSDHADFPELLEHVARVGAARVVVHHGFARDFARILSARGIDAKALERTDEQAAEEA